MDSQENEALRKLACEVLNTALEDLVKPRALQTGDNPEVFRAKATAWLTKPSDGLTIWCELAGVHPDRIMTTAARILKGNSNAAQALNSQVRPSRPTRTGSEAVQSDGSLSNASAHGEPHASVTGADSGG